MSHISHIFLTLFTSIFLLSSTVNAQTDSLVAYWAFEGNLIDEATAGSTVDNAAWAGTPRFTETSPLGDGILLDGSNYLTVSASSDVNAPTGSLTLSAWFRVDQWDTSSQAILAKGLSPNYSIARSNSTDALTYTDGAGNPTGGSVNDGFWHHVIVISSAAETSQMYIDGQLAGSGGASGIIDNGTPLFIGNNPDATSRLWKGAIDDVGILHGTLSPLQAQAIHALGENSSYRYRLPEVLQLIELHTAGDGNSLLLDGDTWVYAVSDPGDRFFIQLGADLSGVTLSPGPAIESFTAQPNFIASGTNSALSWNIEPPFTSVTISPTVGDVTANTNATGQGTFTVQPTATTTYTITATNAAGSNLQKTTVFVGLDPNGPRINEFVARHIDTGELDENNIAQDWLEIFNPGTTPVDLGTYYLTDNASQLNRWKIPTFILQPGAYLRIFTSSLNRRDDTAFLHTDFSLSGDGEFLALTRDDGAGGIEIVNQFSPTYPEQLNGLSYGYSTDASILGFLESPTPAAANGTPAAGFVGDTDFSADRAFYTDPFQLEITATTPDATIHYTLDGSTPTEAHGTAYTGPITISKTSVVRAFAFKANFFPTNVDTQTYLFLDDIRTQFGNGSRPAGWPSGSVNDQVFDYAMDRDITNSLSAQEMRDNLTAIPSISIVTDLNNLINSDTGIYVNAEQRGRDWERPTSVELVDPNDGAEFQIDCGLRIRGGFSRAATNPKHAFRLYFRGEYGDSKLRFPLFGTEGAESFEKMDFRTAQNYSWSFQGQSAGRQNTFLREVLGRDLQGQTGEPYTRSRYYHLYLNGIYWGLFQSQERVDAAYGEEYLGGDEENFDTLKSRGNTLASDRYNTEATDGTFTLGSSSSPGSDWAALYYLTRAQQTSPTTARYLQMQGLDPDGTRNPAFPILLDVDNLINYTMMIGYTGNFDAPLSDFVGASNNWFALRNRESDDRGFNFFVHDGEHSLGANQANKWRNANDRINTTNGSATRSQYLKYNPGYVHLDLAESTPEYRLRFGDLAHKALFSDGILTRNKVLNTVEQRRSIVDQVIHAESARWGDAKRSIPRDKGDWISAVDELQDVIDTRTEVFLGHLRQAGLYPDIEAPMFINTQRSVPPGSAVHLFSEADLIYYTLDGSDPRNADGLPNPDASFFDGTPIEAPTSIIDLTNTWELLASGVDLGDSSITAGQPGYSSAHWKHPDFVTMVDNDPANTTAWKSGNGPLGFGGVTGLTFNTDVPKNNQITTYFRTEFHIDNRETIFGLIANYQADDAIVVYLNGHEILRERFSDGEVITFESTTPNASPESEIFTKELDSIHLVNGRNVLALELHNSSTSSSDLGISFELTAELFNLNEPIPINIPTEIKARTFKASTSEWSALLTDTFVPGSLPTSTNLIISEVNYNPAPLTPTEEANPNVTNNDDFEFIELTNLSPGPLDLSGASFVKTLIGADIEGITYTFPAGSVLAQGQAIILVSNMAAFNVRYPGISPSIIFAEYSGSLNNGGEFIALEDANGIEIARFRYDDRAPWPTRADGDGSTLELSAPGSNPAYADASSWQSSTANNGTPGTVPGMFFTGDALADMDGDGAPALIEYFTGTSDASSTSIDLPEAVIVNIGGINYGGIIFRQNPLAISASFQIESSETLDGDWNTASTVSVNSTTLPDGRIERIYRQTQSINDAPKRFLRVKVLLAE